MFYFPSDKKNRRLPVATDAAGGDFFEKRETGAAVITTATLKRLKPYFLFKFITILAASSRVTISTFAGLPNGSELKLFPL